MLTTPVRAARCISLSLLAFLAWAYSPHAQAQARCEPVEADLPAKGSHIDDSKPEIRWPGNPQVTYRLQVAVVLPEGRLLESVDTQVVGTRWVLGSPIAVPLAAVKVIVSRNCGHYTVQDLHAAAPHFFYDALAQCAIEPMSVVQTQNTLSWKTVAKADKFAITLFEAISDQGKLVEVRRLDRFETTEPHWDMSPVLQGKPTAATSSVAIAMVASVEARCGVLWSQPRAITISALRH